MVYLGSGKHTIQHHKAQYPHTEPPPLFHYFYLDSPSSLFRRPFLAPPTVQARTVRKTNQRRWVWNWRNWFATSCWWISWWTRGSWILIFCFHLMGTIPPPHYDMITTLAQGRFGVRRCCQCRCVFEMFNFFFFFLSLWFRDISPPPPPQHWDVFFVDEVDAFMDLVILVNT